MNLNIRAGKLVKNAKLQIEMANSNAAFYVLLSIKNILLFPPRQIAYNNNHKHFI